MLKHRIVFVIVSLVIVSGCASYTPSLVRLNPSGPNVMTGESGALRLYIEEFATPVKSKSAFDTDLAAEGVLPLLILLQNNGQQTYEVKAKDIAVRGSKPLKPFTPEEAADKASRSAVGRALGWSMIVPIISIPIAVTASAIHTSNVNDKIIQDFKAKLFPDGVILPTKEQSGFLFFEIESDHAALKGLNRRSSGTRRDFG